MKLRKQQEAARRVEAALAALEPLLVQSDGEFSFPEVNLTSLDAEPDDLVMSENWDRLENRVDSRT